MSRNGQYLRLNTEEITLLEDAMKALRILRSSLPKDTQIQELQAKMKQLYSPRNPEKQDVITVDNRSQFNLDRIIIDEHAEAANAIVVTAEEQRSINHEGHVGFRTLWISDKRKQEKQNGG